MCYDCKSTFTCNCDGAPVFGKCPASYGLHCSVCGHDSLKATNAAGKVEVDPKILEKLLHPDILKQARAGAERGE